MLYLAAETEDEANHSLAAAASLPQLSSYIISAKSFAADSLIELKNGEWRDEGDVKLTHNQFVERLTTESIAFYPDGDVELNFGDGGLFSGHVVLVSGTTKGNFSDATIAG